MSNLWLWPIALATAATAALGFRRYAGLVIRVESHSMQPTLRAGQLLLARPVHHASQLRHGDIVVLYCEELQQRIVKRLLGLPGDRLQLDHRGLQRNGQHQKPHQTGDARRYPAPVSHVRFRSPIGYRWARSLPPDRFPPADW